MTQRDLLVGCVIAMVPGKELPASTLYPAQTQDGSLSPTIEFSTRHWLHPFRESKVQFVVEGTWPFRERALVDKTAD